MAANPNLYMQIGKAAYDTSYATVSTIGQYSVNRKLANMQADVLRSQARLSLLSAERQVGYINEAAGQEVWNIGSRGYQFLGTQIASSAASLFDVSTGDRRLFNDNERRTNAMASGVNRSAYEQSFETMMQARLEASRLEYAARAQEAIAKQNSPFRALIASPFAGLGAFAGNVGNLAEAGAFGKSMGKNIGPNMAA